LHAVMYVVVTRAPNAPLPVVLLPIVL